MRGHASRRLPGDVPAFEVLPASLSGRILIASWPAQAAVGAADRKVLGTDCTTNVPGVVAVVVDRAVRNNTATKRLIVHRVLTPSSAIVSKREAISVNPSSVGRHLIADVSSTEHVAHTVELALVFGGVGAAIAQTSAAAVPDEIREEPAISAVTHLVVQMTASGIARSPELAERLATLHPLTNPHEDLTGLQVSVQGVVAIVMADLDVVAIPAAAAWTAPFWTACADRNHGPRLSRNDRLTAVTKHVEVPAGVASVGRRSVPLSTHERELVCRWRGEVLIRQELGLQRHHRSISCFALNLNVATVDARDAKHKQYADQALHHDCTQAFHCLLPHYLLCHSYFRSAQTALRKI